MLERVVIASEASFGAQPQELAALKPINFIYGSNGSGKTTISRVISGARENPNCSLTWTAGRELERRVYNRDFVEANFRSRMAGIFTLGSESAETLARIDECREQIAQLQSRIDASKHTLEGADGQGGKLKDQRDIREQLERDCWTIKARHDPHFQDAMAGFRGAARNFCDKVLNEKASNEADLLNVEALKKRVSTVFEKGLQQEPTLGFFTSARLESEECDPILTKVIIGKEDVDVAELIRKIGNSDWVRQGLKFLPHSEGHCPFCQQGLPHDIEAQLNLYFDETYARDLTTIDRVIEGYVDATANVMTAVRNFADAKPRYLDSDALQSIAARFEERTAANQRLLEGKKKEPSTPITLDPTAPLLVEMNTLIAAANADADEQNRLLANLNAEKAIVTSQVWRLIIDEANDALTRFDNSGADVNAAVGGLQAGLVQKRAEQDALREELQRLERSITSVEPTVTEINKLLVSFGFSGFRLATAGERGGQYEIIRHDGQDATQTLSEGEKTFVTFLYFYHLLRGSASETGITNERVVVFDDPVSSLDSDILFIVSSLIKRLLAEARQGTSQIKQVILLTHNIYFHKEVSFDPNRSVVCRNDETFWIVKKRDAVSIVQGYNHNPIRTSYELLWAEVKNPDRSKLTIQNTLRRIIENYFTILGNINRDAIVELFDGQEKMICGALFSWINDGSHFAQDDIYVASDDETIAKFLDVFRAIFEKSTHGGHYRMMMGDAYVDLIVEAPDPNPAPA